MTAQMTPGPWDYDPDINRVFSVPTNRCVAMPHIASNPAVMEQWPADARAIAATPELIESVAKLLDWLAIFMPLVYTPGYPDPEDLATTVAAASAALAKAKNDDR